MISDISDFINKQSILQTDLVERKIKKLKLISKQQLFVNDLEEAAEAIRNIAQKTKQQIKYKISEAGTLMLESVFDPAPKIHVEFEVKRNQTECQIFFDKQGEMYSPLEEDGFGKADIAGIGLRVAMHHLPAQRSRNILLMDEPCKHVKGAEANIAAIQAIKNISEKMDMQIVMISDERVDISEIQRGADRIFIVDMVDGQSTLEVIDVNNAIE